MRKVTIRDVAKEAGVSISTVSNALNDVDTINAQTKERVLEAVEKLNYIPNLNGRFLKSGESRTLGFFTNTMSGPYFNVLVEAMCREADTNGYNIIIFVLKDVPAIMSNIMGRNLDGVLIFEDMGFNEAEMNTLKGSGIPAVFLDREIADEKISSIVFDSYKGGYDATRYLINLGHKKIGFLAGSPTMYDSRERFRGYRAALAEYGIEYDERHTITGYFSEAYTYNSVKSAARLPEFVLPDAMLAGNDQSAIGCIKALTSEGYSIPKDMSIIGFDDLDVSQYFTPALTTVRNPMARQGLMAVDMLLDLIKGEQGMVRKLDGQLIVRNSCEIVK